MQIVRDLGGYTLGRSDLVRRAMSKKKQSVMEKERVNFIYGNEEEGVPGCISKGISEQVAAQIFDDMMDFAKYAFNKSHAACYAVVAYQTAYLKYYYPVEFMAALLTSVIDNPKKVSEYILACRSMGIELLPPDINEGEQGFSVSGNYIRYALTAIKSVGRPIIEEIVKERELRGKFLNLKDFITRIVDKDVNKRAVENFIKSGALDSLGGTRKQFISVYAQMMEHIVKEKKNNLAGQITLFDIVSEDTKEEFDIPMPQVGEYPKEMLLGFEKEVLGIYISGHPMEEYQEIWQRFVTNTTNDFVLDEESKRTEVVDQAVVIIGGMIADKTIKYTKTNQVMAFLSIEDMVGSVEVIVFPKSYEKYSSLLIQDAKIFIKGKVKVEEEKDGKLICEQIVTFQDAAQAKTNPFENSWKRSRFENKNQTNLKTSYQNSLEQNRQNINIQEQQEEKIKEKNIGQGKNVEQRSVIEERNIEPRTNIEQEKKVEQRTNIGQERNIEQREEISEKTKDIQKKKSKVPEGVWIQFPTKEAYQQLEATLLEAIKEFHGEENIIIYIQNPKSIKILSSKYMVKADERLTEKLNSIVGEGNVKFQREL